ncbi:hypothetical protein PVAP13_4NG330900 [Panicum virgatum]|uniref:Uncharacterized protein n=1 Tax=Panicum virgatum TaxID=38727 RepID=A0A8T0T9P0_PANVG|nr:hypothetical protein PVAP13_4NG330900 [Panicum virgatum]
MYLPAGGPIPSNSSSSMEEENSPPPAPAAAEATRPDPLHPGPAAMRPPSPPHAFPTLDSLAAFLRPRLPPQALSSWGAVPGTKTLLNLFLELSHGDCALHLPAAPPPRVVRAVHVATVRIRNRRGARLVEARQLLSDGTVRRRGPRPLSEKMRRAGGARRGRPRPDRGRAGGARGGAGVGVLPGAPRPVRAARVDAELLGGVPEDGAFETEETGEDDGDAGAGAITVKRHYWEWVDGEDNEPEEVAAAAAGAGSH